MGETNEFIAITASSFLFIFIKRLVGFYSPKCKDFPHYDSLVETEYVWAVDEDEEEVLITLDELDCDYEIEYGTPDIAGRVYGFHIEELWGNEDDYGELLDRLNNEDSDFKKEYIRLREYLDELREKQNPVGDNLLELL